MISANDLEQVTLGPRQKRPKLFCSKFLNLCFNCRPWKNVTFIPKFLATAQKSKLNFLSIKFFGFKVKFRLYFLDFYANIFQNVSNNLSFHFFNNVGNFTVRNFLITFKNNQLKNRRSGQKLSFLNLLFKKIF